MQDTIAILIVEDDVVNAYDLKAQLENYGYHIVGLCHTYEDAMLAIAQQEFDLLLTDINLGDGVDVKSGLDVITGLKLIKDCPVIVLSAYSDKDTITKASKLNPAAYLVKPYSGNSVFAAIHLAIENFSLKKNGLTDLNQENTLDHFFTKQGQKLIKVFWNKILHIQSNRNYISITTSDLKYKILIRSSINNFMQNMIPENLRENFVRINRAEVISLSIVNKIEIDTVITSIGNFELSNEDIIKKIQNIL